MDFYLFELFNMVDHITDGEIFTRYPTVKDYNHRVASLPGIKEYIASDKFIKEPFNGDMAKIGGKT